ncbi:hypothetical protein [Micromonospora sp. NPDC047527]|uniref:hypothetical protein n=1 Tax=unclassified Micromonospora TaxID=2617518 RepID=UPI0033CF3C0C
MELGIIPDRTELSRAATVALLSPVLGYQPDLRERVAEGDYAELTWTGDRISTQWFIHPGRTGIGELVVSVFDRHSIDDAAAFRAELAPIVSALRELARTADARLVVEEGDFTDAPLDVILDHVAPDGVLPPGMVRGTVTGTPEEFLHRYLAAGDGRLRWLRDESGVDLDLSRDSLAAVWDWALGSLQPRPVGAPIEKVATGSGFFPRPTNAVLPMWYGRHASMAPSGWSDDSLRIIDAVAFYALECVRHAVPGTAWRVGHEAEWGYRYEGLPVLGGRGADLEPVHELIPLAGRLYKQLRGDPVVAAGADLSGWYDAAVGARG